jgi:hypothetical protein
MSTTIADLEAGTVLRGPVYAMTLPRILAFSSGLFGEPGWPHRNLHTDMAMAQDAGLPAIIASGTQFEGHLVEFLMTIFGASWLEGGELTVRIPRSVHVDDTVCAVVRVLSIESRGEERAYELAVSVENQRGELVLDGTASFRERVIREAERAIASPPQESA